MGDVGDLTLGQQEVLEEREQQLNPSERAMLKQAQQVLAPIGEAIAAGVAESRRRHARRAPRTISRRPRARARRSPVTRRASSSSTTSGADPGGDPDPHRAPAVSLRLAPPARAVLTFGYRSRHGAIYGERVGARS